MSSDKRPGDSGIGSSHDDTLRKLPNVPKEDAPQHEMVEYREALDNLLAKLKTRP